MTTSTVGSTEAGDTGAGLPARDGVARWCGIGSAVAVLCVGATGALLLAPLPGPHIDLRDPIWHYLEALERVDAGDTKKGCLWLESGLVGLRGRQAREAKHTSDFIPASVEILKPRYDEAIATCVDEQIELLSSIRDPSLKSAGFHAFELPTCGLDPDETQQRRIDDELAELPPAPPHVCNCWGRPFFNRHDIGCSRLR